MTSRADRPRFSPPAGLARLAPGNLGKGAAMLVIVGSVNADLFFHPDHLPVPGATVLCPDYTVHTGGKGANQAVAAARAGARVAMVGAVGDDAFADAARQTLADAGVDVDGLITSPGATGTAVVAVDGRGENQIIVAGGANGRVSLAQVAALDFGAVTTLLLQMEIPRPTIEAAIDRALAEASVAGARACTRRGPQTAPTADEIAAVLAGLDAGGLVQLV